MRFNRRMSVGLLLLGVLALAAAMAPLLVGDPLAISTASRLSPPSLAHPFGTDNFGRSVLNRTIYGGRISLVVGAAVAAISLVFGLAIGLVAGYFRRIDDVVMRVMDGIMAIPSVLLAIAVVTLTGSGVGTVIVAIAVPEVPRVVRLVRALVLIIRELPFVEAAVASGSSSFKVLRLHILPHAIAPLTVQATYIAGSAILTEAALSFLGIGTPASIPTWGNMIANARNYFALAPWVILFPGTVVSIAVLAVNLFGDGLRDRLDPRLARRVR
jgi:peptide/nickel transport system permease protein